MTTKSTKQTNFLHNEDGSTVPAFALLFMSMLTSIGGAIDVGQAVSTRMNMQQALDAATIAVCTRGNRDAEEVMRAFLADQLGKFGKTLQAAPQGGNEAPAPTGNEVQLSNALFDPITGAIKPTLTTTQATNILKLVGFDEIDIQAMSNVKCGSKRLELSLVMDVTGSMNHQVGGIRRIDSLKEAANDVLDIFQYNIDAGATRIALVPFSETVNVGSTYAPLVRGTIRTGTSTSTTSPRTTLKFRDPDNNWAYYNISNCVSERINADKYTDKAPGCSGNTCTSRVGLVYTPNGSCAPGNQLVPLSSDRAALAAQINAYQPAGWTAGQIGAAWGWYTLSPKWASVWTNNVPEEHNPEELIKATIIMTDGEFNTQYRDGVQDRHHKNSATNGSSNTQFEAICNAMKNPTNADEKIVVYTVGFGLDPNSSHATRLKNCATDNTKWFFPYDGAQLRAAFVSIGNQLAAGQAGQAIVQE